MLFRFHIVNTLHHYCVFYSLSTKYPSVAYFMIIQLCIFPLNAIVKYLRIVKHLKSSRF